MLDRSNVSAVQKDRILFVTHVAIRQTPEGLWIDDQTAEGLVRWCENFGQVSYAGIELAEEDVAKWPTITWVRIEDLPCSDRLNIIRLPRAYRIGAFSGAYKRTRALLADEIARSGYLCFTLGAVVGDWAAIGALEAIKQRRRYAVWFDRVEHEVVRSDLPNMPLKRRMKERITLLLMPRYHRYLIERSQLGLFQGKDCYDHYSQFTDKGFCVYDTHTKTSDFIDHAMLRAKIAGAHQGEPLRICYVGRAADMKGPIDWIEVLAKARDAGVPFKATWFGDGPMIEEMRQMVADRGLDGVISLPGFLSDRGAVLDAMRDAHVFLFCHKTPESPRCLIEALVSGTPIVGYASAYARDLVAGDGGGDFVDVIDVRGLADRLIALNENRQALADLIAAAAKSGLRFDEQTVYRYRAGLLRDKL
ncbi:MAG: glycosyltransferase [Hyphomicrobium sp.]|nr:glycosyltransferase [Hyphomicrobium sp.]